MSNNKALVPIYNKLEVLLQSKAQALPKDFNETRFLQNSMTVLESIKGIEKIDSNSVARTILRGAFLGLDFFNKECYAIPYNYKEGNSWVNDIQFQTDYKGERKLALKYSRIPVKTIYAKLVRKGDSFEEVIINGEPSIDFKPKAFNNGGILGAFAVCLYKDGSMIYEVMSKEEIEEIKENFSKKSKKTGEFSGAWVKTPGEMYKKTVLRRLCKGIDLFFDSIEQANAWEESSDFDFDQEKKEDKVDIKNFIEENDEYHDAETGEIIEPEKLEVKTEEPLKDTLFGDSNDNK